MKKPYVGIMAVLVFVLFLSGCETAKGFSSGLSKDVQTGTHFLMGLDDWMRENLW